MSEEAYETESSAQFSPEKLPEPQLPSHDVGSSSREAPYRYLPKQAFTSIEYPGPVSHPGAILNVCSQEDINDCFNIPSSSKNAVLEMRYRPGDSSGVPVRGHRAPSQKLLMRVVRRRKRRKADSESKGKQKEEEEGIFTAEVVGTVAQTILAAMADWHFTPNAQGPTAELVDALKALDYNAILDFSFAPLNEDFLEPTTNPLDPEIHYISKLDLQPPPLFSSRNLPYVYNFKMPNQTVEEEVYDARTGQTKLRYVNKSRVAGVGPINIPHKHKLGEVPKEPTLSAKSRIPELDPGLLERLRQKFEERPVWMRHSLYGQFGDEDKRELQRVKAYVPCVAYIMGTGPFWKCLVRFGYDPCADSVARQYQRIFFYPNKKVIRNPLNTQAQDSDDEEDPTADDKGVGWWEAEQERMIAAGDRPPLDPSKEHVFDGQYLHRRRGDYQLCDVTDPLIAKYINDRGQFEDTCSFMSGWYTPLMFTLIKTLVRIKYMYMWEHARPAPDQLCFEAIEDYERGKLSEGEAEGEGEGEGGQGEDEEREGEGEDMESD